MTTLLASIASSNSPSARSRPACTFSARRCRGSTLERAPDQRLRVAQALLPSLFIVAVQHLEHVGGRDAGKSIDVVWVVVERALEELARGDHRLPRGGPVGDRLAAHHEVNGARIVLPLAASRLAINYFQTGGAGDATDDLVLHFEEAGQLLVETLGPELAVILSVDEPGVDPQSIAIRDEAAGYYVADPEFTADLGRLSRLTLV